MEQDNQVLNNTDCKIWSKEDDSHFANVRSHTPRALHLVWFPALKAIQGSHTKLQPGSFSG